jgi:hypothetical protein
MKSRYTKFNFKRENAEGLPATGVYNTGKRTVALQ